MRKLFSSQRVRSAREVILQPDILLPEQLLALRYTPPRGAKRLLLAMLEDAIHCFQAYLFAKTPHEQRLFAEAEEWIFASDPHWFFSFERTCEFLGFHPDRVRRALKQWKLEQHRRQLHDHMRAGVERATARTLEPNESVPPACTASANGKSLLFG